jgi:hypothetical protein
MMGEASINLHRLHTTSMYHNIPAEHCCRSYLVEEGPSIGEEFFHLVGLRRRGGVPAGIEDLVVFRCVAARGVWL